MNGDEMINQRWNNALISYTISLGCLQLLLSPYLPIRDLALSNGGFMYGFMATPILGTPGALLYDAVGVNLWQMLGWENFVTIQNIIYALSYIGLAGSLYFRPSRKIIRAAEVFLILNFMFFVSFELFLIDALNYGLILTYTVIIGTGIYITEITGGRWILSRVGSSNLSTRGGGGTPSDMAPASDNDQSSSVTQNNTSSDESDETTSISDADISGQKSVFGVVNDRVDEGDTLRDEADDYYEDGKYDRGLDTYDEAKGTYEDALERASESDLISTDEIEQKLAAVEEARQEIHHQRLQEQVESLRSDLDHADSLADGGDLEQAQEQLTDLESRLTPAKETATQHNFDDVQEEIETLERRREERLTEVTDRRQSHPISYDIPRAPDVSVDYDALTDEEPIGGGGNADVSKATLSTPSGNTTLAIKRPRMAGTLHTDKVERMLQEAETWDKLDDHDHIVGVVDYGSEPIPWIAMEYMDGGHLGDRSGAMEIPQALWTALAVTKGVRHAHRRGIAHLDLKPQNVLFRTVEDAWDVPKVADWGLSKHLLEHSKSVEGMSVEYAAPEQFDEDYGTADDITDVYQLGAMFYELFTGRPPFEGQPFKVIEMVKSDRPTPPSEIADVPGALDEILLTALAKEKADRYDDVLYLRDELQELFDNW